jgi:pantothenate kinase
MTVEEVGLQQLVSDTAALAGSSERVILGIAGAPGAGKSTVAEALVAALGTSAVLVGLDGFHLANSELIRLDRLSRKGSPDTFDAAGYVSLLRRLRSREDSVVYAPRFDRDLEESIGSAVAVPAEVPLVVTEGNYLLVDDEHWGPVRQLLDACWYVDPGDETRLGRLVARHERYGRSPAEARDRSYGSDQRNAELIQATRGRADRVIRLTD